MHSTAIGSVDAIGPLDLAMLPEVVAARSFRAHLAIGGVILALLVAAVNLALTVFVLHPIGVMHQRIDGMEHGRWRGDVRATSGDEVGTLDAAFQRLGPELDALMAHALLTAANILGSVRQLDRLFLPAAGRGSRHRPERRLDGAA
jgi:HAMP domain-containing protein